jgi:hypothetical protein
MPGREGAFEHERRLGDVEPVLRAARLLEGDIGLVGVVAEAGIGQIGDLDDGNLGASR